MLVVATLAPELIGNAFAASDRPGREKHFTKGLLLRMAFARAGRDTTHYLPQIVPPNRHIPWGEALSRDLRVLHIAHEYGLKFAATYCPEIEQFDPAALRDLSLEFVWRYNTNLIGLMPQGLREVVLEIFHHCGILPFNESDFAELEAVRRLLVAAGVRYDPRPLPA